MKYYKIMQQCESDYCFLPILSYAEVGDGGKVWQRGHEKVTKQMTGNPVWGNADITPRERPVSPIFSQIYLPM